ncbi:hypothetical protein JYK21_23280 [Ralstonia pickettii]|nr:hypothetical protein [Ralstonia pickettii]
MAIKMAAFNLLPLPTLNGGTLVALVASSGFARIWRPRYTQTLVFVYLALLLSWLSVCAIYLV